MGDNINLSNSNIDLKKFMEYLWDKVIDLQFQYVIKYHKNPKYIKVPMWFIRELDRTNNEINTYSTIRLDEEGTEPHFMGMRIIETPTIETLKEIEVL